VRCPPAIVICILRASPNREGGLRVADSTVKNVIKNSRSDYVRSVPASRTDFEQGPPHGDDSTCHASSCYRTAPAAVRFIEADKSHSNCISLEPRIVTVNEGRNFEMA